MSQGNASFDRVVVARHHIRRRFIVLKQSDMRLSAFTMTDTSGELVGAFLYAEKSSSFFLSNSTVSEMTSLEQGLIFASDSRIAFSQVALSNYNVTFVSAVSSNVSVNLTTVSDGGRRTADSLNRYLTTSGFLDCKQCGEVLFRNSSFSRLRGKSGSAISAVSSSTTQSRIVIYGCEFHSCAADFDGGVGRFVSVTLYFAFSTVINSTAKRGGGVFIDCAAEGCASTIAGSLFAYNSAVEGGAVKWTGARPRFFDNWDSNNSAVYGPFEASVPNRLKMGRKDIVQPPGQRITTPIVVELRDVLGQVVLTDNSTFISLRLMDSVSSSGVQFMGDMRVLSSRGLGNFSALLIRARPQSSISMQAFVSAAPLQVNFSLVMRACEPGEVTSAEGCYQCPKGSYSVNPSDTDCKHCPATATCPGAELLILQSDYWRPSRLSDAIFRCPEEGLCAGGEMSECGEGYEGRLCSVCAEGHFSLGHVYCFPCSSNTVQVIIAASALLLPFGVVTWATCIVANDGSPKVRLVTARVIVGFLQWVLVVSTITVGWKYQLSLLMVADEVFLSVGAASITMSCFGNSLSWVYWKAIIASAVPVAVWLSIALMFAIRTLFSPHSSLLCDLPKSAFVVFQFSCIYVSKSTLDLLVCRRMEGEDYWLLADMSERCWLDDHLRIVKTVLVPLCVVYVLGYPLALLGIYYKTRQRDAGAVLLFVTAGLRDGEESWEVWLTARKAAILIVVAGLSYGPNKVQVLATLGGMYFNLYLQLFRAPYVHSLHNYLEGSVQVAVFLFSSVSFYFQETLPLQYAVKKAISLATFGVTLAYLAVLLACLAKGSAGVKEEKVVPECPEESRGNSFLTEKVFTPANSVQSSEIT